MIFNNYRGMAFIREEMGARLTPELVFELHRILTEGTLDDPTAAGRLQRLPVRRDRRRRLLDGGAGFNHRQLALLSDALRHGDRVYTFGVHARTHRVTHETARADISQLAGRGLLDRHQLGRRYRFTAPPDLAARLRSGAGA